MRLSREFNLAEYLHSETADTNGIREQYYPDLLVRHNLRVLHERVIVPLMDQLPGLCWLNIRSGWRCMELNKRVGGAKNSEHLYGYAADIECYDESGKECNEIILNLFKAHDWEFTQLISEKGSKKEPNWVHISYNQANLKCQVLRVSA